MSAYLDMLKRLTDAYNKDPDSNTGKLLKIIGTEIDQLEQTTQDIKAAHQIDNATGYSLDRIGNNVQQLRGQITDEIYRVLIKSKTQRNLSDGSVETLIKIFSFLLNIPANEVEIIELWNNEPASFQLNVPASALNSIGLSVGQFGELVDIVAAAGVKAVSLFQGTFSFSSQESVSETDSNAGFADLAQTTGGTLGAYYDPNTDVPLPI
jgi:hypothetical protein